VGQPDDTMNSLDLLLVTNIEIKPASHRAGRQGKARR
jgi:hypothetical protein